jgi:hypothetical protein
VIQKDSSRKGVGGEGEVDGTRISMMTDGTRISMMTDGTRSSMMTDGTRISMMTDGTRISMMTDGTRSSMMTDGTRSSMMTDGTRSSMMTDALHSKMLNATLDINGKLLIARDIDDVHTEHTGPHIEWKLIHVLISTFGNWLRCCLHSHRGCWLIGDSHLLECDAVIVPNNWKLLAQ